VNSVELELGLVSLAAMLSPTTLTFSILVLVLSRQPLRSGFWFYLGALAATVGIGIVAAFVLGDAAAASDPSTPKTWVAIVDLVAGTLIVAWVIRVLRRPRDPARTGRMIDQIRKVTESPAIAIIGAGATLANPGGFIPLALKEISELDPSRTEYALEWLAFSFVSLLPLAVSLLLLVVARDWTKRVLDRVRAWLELHARTIAAVIVLAVAAALLRNGIAGLVN
jgi:hypothetical protein